MGEQGVRQHDGKTFSSFWTGCPEVGTSTRWPRVTFRQKMGAMSRALRTRVCCCWGAQRATPPHPDPCLCAQTDPTLCCVPLCKWVRACGGGLGMRLAPPKTSPCRACPSLVPSHVLRVPLAAMAATHFFQGRGYVHGHPQAPRRNKDVAERPGQARWPRPQVAVALSLRLLEHHLNFPSSPPPSPHDNTHTGPQAPTHTRP